VELPVYNTAGEIVDKIELSDDVFGVPMNSGLVHQAMVAQLANQRIGTAATKTRGQVSGGGRKPYRQKGTGRARQGTIRAPHYRGGGVVFGPHPRSYHQAMPRKARLLAMKCVLADKVAEKHLIVVNQLDVAEPKTRAIVQMLSNLPVERSTLITLAQPNENVLKSARNIPGVDTIVADTVSLLDVLRHNYIVMPVDAVRKIEARLAS